MSICYALIIRQLRKTQARHCSVIANRIQENPHHRQVRRSLSAATLKSERKFRRVNVTCVLLVLLFLFCWLPYHSYHFAKRHGIRGSVSGSRSLIWLVSSGVVYLLKSIPRYNIARIFLLLPQCSRTSTQLLTHLYSPSLAIDFTKDSGMPTVLACVSAYIFNRPDFVSTSRRLARWQRLQRDSTW